MFDSFNTWRSHEMDHRRECVCPICGLLCQDKPKTRAHLSHFHGDMIENTQVDALLQTSSRPPEHLKAADCPFCDWSLVLHKRNITPHAQDLVVPSRRFMKHLGRHLEDFALFVVPQPDEDDGDLNDVGSNEVHVNDINDNDSVSTLSSFRSALSTREDAYAKFEADSTLQPGAWSAPPGTRNGFLSSAQLFSRGHIFSPSLNSIVRGNHSPTASEYLPPPPYELPQYSAPRAQYNPGGFMEPDENVDEYLGEQRTPESSMAKPVNLQTLTGLPTFELPTSHDVGLIRIAKFGLGTLAQTDQTPQNLISSEPEDNFGLVSLANEYQDGDLHSLEPQIHVSPGSANGPMDFPDAPRNSQSQLRKFEDQDYERPMIPRHEDDAYSAENRMWSHQYPDGSHTTPLSGPQAEHLPVPKQPPSHGNRLSVPHHSLVNERLQTANALRSSSPSSASVKSSPFKPGSPITFDKWNQWMSPNSLPRQSNSHNTLQKGSNFDVTSIMAQQANAMSSQESGNDVVPVGIQSMLPMPGAPPAQTKTGRRCFDYDVKGFCARGASCPDEHGEYHFVASSANRDLPNEASGSTNPAMRASRNHQEDFQSPTGLNRLNSQQVQTLARQRELPPPQTHRHSPAVRDEHWRQDRSNLSTAPWAQGSYVGQPYHNLVTEADLSKQRSDFAADLSTTSPKDALLDYHDAAPPADAQPPLHWSRPPVTPQYPSNPDPLPTI